MEFRVLGPLEVRDGDRTISVGGGRRRALLALLLLHRNEVVPAERLINELWEGDPPPSAGKGLQVHVSHLRKELATGSTDGRTALLTRPPGYVLEVDPQSIDAVRFERAVSEGVRAQDAGRPGKAVAHLREALELWHGPPLMDFAYDAFAREEIARLEELHLLALEEQVEAQLALGHHREALAELEQLVADHASSERLRGLLMIALYRSGRRAEALDVYRDGRQRSVDELGIELGPELRALQAAVLTDDPALASPPREAAIPPKRAAALLLLAAALLAAAASGAIVLEDRAADPPGQPVPDLAQSSVAGLGAGGRPVFAVRLPGRPTDLAAQGDQLYAVSADAPALTIADARTRRLTRTVALPMLPAAVAAGDGSVWVADRRRGLALRLDARSARIAERVTWRRPRAATASAGARPTGMAVAGGVAWIADGSRTIIRARGTGDVRRTRLREAADGVAAGAGAVWAFDHRRSTVMRLDARSGRLTDRVTLASRRATGAPKPTAIAASRTTVWVLNGNTATLTRIDARTRTVVATIPLPIERSPRDVAAAGGTVWVACFDGSVIQVLPRTNASRTSFTRGALVAVAAAGQRAWVAATALNEPAPSAVVR